MDWYAILAIDPTASDAEIRKAYRRAALKCHPDKVKEFNADKFGLISDAFRVLSDPNSRRQFDAQIANHRPTLRSDTEKTFFRQKLAKQETYSEPQPVTSLESLQQDFEHRRQTLQSLMNSQRQQNQSYRTLLHTNQSFSTVFAARKHIDTFGGYLQDSYMEPEYSLEYEKDTMSRIPAD